mgnify:CR=1 FL=1
MFLSENYRSQVLTLAASIAKDLSVECYLVGGAVRDALGGIDLENIRDFDFVLSANLDSFINLFQEKLIKLDSERKRLLNPHKISKYPKYHTAKVGEYDFSLFRRETYSGIGSMPVISNAQSIEEDLRRRDFTVNALGVSLSSDFINDDFNNLIKDHRLFIDPCGGLLDFNLKKLRFIHDQSLYDDPVRLLRGIRLKIRLGYEFDLRSVEMMDFAIKNKFLEKVPNTRYFEEIKKIFMEKDISQIFNLINSYELLDQIFPGVDISELNFDVLSDISSLSVEERMLGLLSNLDRVKLLEALSRYSFAGSSIHKFVTL